MPGHTETMMTNERRLWLSVITPVRDALPELRRTWESLQAQDLSNVEWIIVDSSTDRDEIPGFIATLAGFTPHYRWESPAGVFAAMNHGLALAQGDYVYFLNAGDTLKDSRVLDGVHRVLAEHGSAQWAYGDVELLDDRGRPMVAPAFNYDEERRRLFARGAFPCHQATFVQRTVLEHLGGFSTNYVVAGDYEMVLKLDQVSRPRYIPRVIARFEPGGLSSTAWRQGLREFHNARRRVFTPKGGASLRELLDTMAFGGKTVMYRALWAPGRPFHRLARSISG